MDVLVCVWSGSGVYLIAADSCTLPLEARHFMRRQSLRDDRKDQSPLSSFRLRMNQLAAVLCTLRTIEDTPVIILCLHTTRHVSLPFSFSAFTPYARGFVAISSHTEEHFSEYALMREEPHLSRRRMCTRREHTCSAHALLHVGMAAGPIIHSCHTCNEKRLSLQKRSQSERTSSDPIAFAPLAFCTPHCKLYKPNIGCCSTNSYALQHFLQTLQSTLLNTSTNAHITLICSESLCSNLLTSLRPFEQFPILLAIITRDCNVGVFARDQHTIKGVGKASAPQDATLQLSRRIYGSINVAALFDKSDAQCRLDSDPSSGLLICVVIAYRELCSIVKALFCTHCVRVRY